MANNTFTVAIRNSISFTLQLANFIIAETLFTIMKIKTSSTAFLSTLSYSNSISKIRILMPVSALLEGFLSTTTHLKIKMSTFLTAMMEAFVNSKISIKMPAMSHALLYSMATLNFEHLTMTASVLLGTQWSLGYYDADTLGSMDSSTLGNLDFTAS